MPAIQRKAAKLIAKGLNLAMPVDLLPPGEFPKLVNCTVNQLGQIETRPGSQKLFTFPDNFVHSMRRLDNTVTSGLTTSFIVGAGSNLYGGNAPGLIASGFNGAPLSLVSYRPDQSPEPWMYVANNNKLVKVNAENVVQNVGIAPPASAPVAEIAPPYYRDVAMTTLGAWVAGGTSGSASNPSRTGTISIAFILYDSGNTGWACIEPNAIFPGLLHAGERVVLNGAETVTIESVSNAITTTTISSILYDSGTTGPCSIVLGAQSQGLNRNSLLTLNAETVRVLSVTMGPNGIPSFRCSTTGTHAAGETVTGLPSFRCYTTTTIAAGQNITDVFTLQFTVSKGTGFQTRPTVQDLSTITEFGVKRAVQLGDYMHISISLDNPQCLIEGRVLIDVDAVSNDFNHNYYYKTFRANDLLPSANSALPSTTVAQTVISNTAYDNADPRSTSSQLGLGALQFTELTFPISDLVRVGLDQTRTLANTQSIRLQLTIQPVTIAGTTYSTVTGQWDSWWIGGTYGTNVIIGSPTGIQYQYRYRSSATGARSNPSPTNRYQLFPSSQAINLTMTSSTDPQVDLIDVQRYDPNLQSAGGVTWTYVATIPNGSPTYQDQSLAASIAGNPPFETDRYQPFPVLGLPLSGTCNVSGTSVVQTSGSTFPTNLAPGTVINIGTAGQSTTYQTFTVPASGTFLELQTSAGPGTGVPFNIYSPVLMGTPMATMFGPLEGPQASFLFAMLDSRNPGTVYWTNGNDPDSASVLNSIEITPPSEPLIGGAVWNTLVYVFSHTRVFILRPSFDATGNFQFTFYAIPAPSGLWSPWAICAGVDGVYYLGNDGVYKIAGEAITSVTDNNLYPLFPHMGQAQGDGTVDYPAVDMTGITRLRLNFVSGEIYFTYPDVNGAMWTARIHDVTLGWFPQQWPIQATLLYFEEVPVASQPRILIASRTGFISVATGTTDDGVPIPASFRTPSYDLGDPRAQKLFIDAMTDYSGSSVSLTLGFDNNLTILGQVPLPAAVTRTQTRNNISSLTTLTLYRNICALYSFNADGKVYEFEPSGYMQPYLMTSLVLRGDNGFSDWHLLRSSYWALISTVPVTLQVDIDGVQNQYILGGTNGALRKVYLQFLHASKGKEFVWQLSCPSPFAFFADESTIQMKPWRGQQLIDTRPFADAGSVVDRASDKAARG